MTGDLIIPYYGSGSWSANSTCTNNYEWFLKKEDWGGYVSIQDSRSRYLTLNSVSSNNKKPAPLPFEQTMFQLFVRAKNINGNYYQTEPISILALGNVDLVVGRSDGLPPFELKISPNPVSSILTVDIKNSKSNSPNTEYTVRLLNKYQKTVYQKTTKATQIPINVSSLQIGIYYLQVINGQDMQTEKVIVID
ncbi:MAG: T9SS type A sorting domain-containing protein [Bacteroidota bacterium]|nr:T9SS type A sorting domain-containing protein [Bacteroidota bacterium]